MNLWRLGRHDGQGCFEYYKIYCSGCSLGYVFLWCTNDPIWAHPGWEKGIYGGKLYYFQQMISGLLTLFAGYFVLEAVKFSQNIKKKNAEKVLRSFSDITFFKIEMWHEKILLIRNMTNSETEIAAITSVFRETCAILNGLNDTIRIRLDESVYIDLDKDRFEAAIASVFLDEELKALGLRAASFKFNTIEEFFEKSELLLGGLVNLAQNCAKINPSVKVKPIPNHTDSAAHSPDTL